MYSCCQLVDSDMAYNMVDELEEGQLWWCGWQWDVMVVVVIELKESDGT